MIIDGRKLALKREIKLKKEILVLNKIKKRNPVLISFVAYEDKPGLLYTKLKKKTASRLGIKFISYYFTLKNEKTLGKLIDKVILDQKFDGLMIQKPGQNLVNKFFKDKKSFEIWWLTNTSKIPEKKDVDCLNVANLGLLSAGLIQYYPATVKAVLLILLTIYKKEQLKGKEVLIIGSSEILGKPLAMILRNNGASVMLLGSSAKNLTKKCKQADIIISGVGKPNLIKENMVNKKTILIDAGIARLGKKLVGDVDFDKVYKKVSYITPVPGGVGPLTVICLMENLVKSFKK